MSQAIAINLDKSSELVLVSGELTFSTVKSVLNEIHSLVGSLSTLQIDLSDVTRSDSAGLALLVHWMRAAKQAKKPLFFHHIPAQMLAIASASGLDEFLPVPNN
ncbi:MAG: STAS domain-containing protein [Piscirickettsiaceae bacterium]|jgi:phospholipid transport system transporter-binding protein|nr:STAS domain-containing protein [Piscirickettsiaceae bacterium]